MNDIKRNSIEEVLRISKNLYQSVSLLEEFEDKVAEKNLKRSITYCRQICRKIDGVLSAETVSHTNVPGNLYMAGNTMTMRDAIKSLHIALIGYSTVLKKLEGMKGKGWSARIESVFDCEIEIESCEAKLNYAM